MLSGKLNNCINVVCVSAVRSTVYAAKFCLNTNSTKCVVEWRIYECKYLNVLILILAIYSAGK